MNHFIFWGLQLLQLAYPTNTSGSSTNPLIPFRESSTRTFLIDELTSLAMCSVPICWFSLPCMAEIPASYLSIPSKEAHVVPYGLKDGKS